MLLTSHTLKGALTGDSVFCASLCHVDLTYTNGTGDLPHAKLRGLNFRKSKAEFCKDWGNTVGGEASIKPAAGPVMDESLQHRIGWT